MLRNTSILLEATGVKPSGGSPGVYHDLGGEQYFSRLLLVGKANRKQPEKKINI